MRPLMGEERWNRLVSALDEPAPVSIRLNPQKVQLGAANVNNADGSVAWCEEGVYLKQRPHFTFDPLLHAGAYYVQEASSMFLDTVLQQYLPNYPVCMLDLCAAPGGKSTVARAALSEGSLLFSNEPIGKRASILAENILKWGHPDIIVTSNYARDFQKNGMLFDVILTDVPCSGEGMFRKDEGAINEWSLENVEKCARLQRGIIEDIWPCLKPGGLLIYSTCTFNTKENEENIRWIQQEMGAEVLPVKIQPEWNITSSLLDGFHEPVYRFIPGKTRGEGLFMAVMRKHGGEKQIKFPTAKQLKGLRVLAHGVKAPIQKGKDLIPDVSEALSTTLDRTKYPMVELTYEQAVQYLRKEVIVLPAQTPRGLAIVNYRQHPLGFVKNIGNRANNLYPQEWKIKSTHIPDKIEMFK